jgi:hypothetical protein
MNEDYSEDDIAYGVELQGVYDGVAYWVLHDGRWVNLFRGEGSRREQLVDEHIAKHWGPRDE